MIANQQWAVVAVCLPCAKAENWDLSQSPSDHEFETDSRMAPVHADHEEYYAARGYQTLTGEPVSPTDSGRLFICPHLEAEAFAD
jgi:hypothetical protein